MPHVLLDTLSATTPWWAGDRAAAGPFMLSNPGGSHFGRGALDAFVVGGAPDVGTIRQVSEACMPWWRCWR